MENEEKEKKEDEIWSCTKSGCQNKARENFEGESFEEEDHFNLLFVRRNDIHEDECNSFIKDSDPFILLKEHHPKREV